MAVHLSGRPLREVSLVLCVLLMTVASCATTNHRVVQQAAVAAFATGGTGTRVDPWTGWETAVNALPADALIHFGTGYYATFATLIVKTGWTIEGDGWSSVLVIGTLGTDILRAAGVDNLIIRNLQIDATGQTGADAHGIRVINGTNVLLDGIWVHHAAWDGIRLGPSGSESGTADAVRIANSLLEYNTSMGIGATDFQDLTVTGNIIRRNKRNGMDLEPTAAPERANVNARVTITGNTITGNAGTGINLYNWTGGASKGFTTITGNVIVENGGGYGVQIRSQTNTVVNANIIARSLIGVYVYGGSTYTAVSGNTIGHMSDSGVKADGEATRHTAVSGNMIHDCNVGISAVNGADYLTLIGNHLTSNNRDVNALGPHSKSTGNSP